MSPQEQLQQLQPPPEVAALGKPDDAVLMTRHFGSIHSGFARAMSATHLWVGGLEPGEPHHYLIQCPTFLIEYDNTQDGANHVHCVYRDFDNDFGDALLE